MVDNFSDTGNDGAKNVAFSSVNGELSKYLGGGRRGMFDINKEDGMDSVEGDYEIMWQVSVNELIPYNYINYKLYCRQR